MWHLCEYLRAQRELVFSTELLYLAHRAALQTTCGICSNMELDTKPERKSDSWTTCVLAHYCWVWPNLLGTGSSEKPVSIYKLLEQLHSLIISKLQESKKGQMNSSDNILTDNVLTFLKHSKGAFQIGFGRWKKWTECSVCSQKYCVMAASVILLQYWTFFDLQKLKQSVSEEIAPGCCDRKEMYCVNAGASYGTERCCASGKLIGKHLSNTRVQKNRIDMLWNTGSW